METMQSETANNPVIPGFLSSHPLTEERLLNATKLAEKNPCSFSPADPEKVSLFRQLKEQP
jgi:predicted Zn-dependent protease